MILLLAALRASFIAVAAVAPSSSDLAPPYSNSAHTPIKKEGDNIHQKQSQQQQRQHHRRLADSDSYHPVWESTIDSSYCDNSGDYFGQTYESQEECCLTWFPQQPSGFCLNWNRQVLRDDGQCHDIALESQSSATNATYNPYGLVFSIENIGSEMINISSLSVDMVTDFQVNYTLYVMDGFYITERANDGTIISTAIGKELDGQLWQEVCSGTFETTKDFILDDDGATILPFSSFHGVGLQPGDVKSFYLKLNDIVLMVERYDSLVGEAYDGLVSVSDSYSGLKMYVGRGVSGFVLCG